MQSAAAGINELPKVELENFIAALVEHYSAER